MSKEQLQERARSVYLLLAALFITALVVCNLIANKFVEVDLGFKTFILSAGVLPYPITFLITDILSEVYGQRRTNQVVLAGFAASVFVLFVLWLGHLFPAIPESPVKDESYDQVFQNSFRVIMASMLAYLTAQFVDVRMFHFWKKLTRNKHLWIRNNFSTVVSQLLDTVLVVTVIFIGRAAWGQIGDMVLDGWLFKVLCALGDTAIIYPLVWGFRSYFKLQPGEEITL